MSTDRMRQRQAGLTLVELVLFMVIMGVAAAGIMGVFNLANRQSADPVRRAQAMLITEALMEEVQLAKLTFCEPTDANALTASAVGDCTSRLQVAVKGGISRPYPTVADYATQLATAQPRFAVGGVDRDVNGRALGTDALGNTMGNGSLAPITSTIALNVLPAADALNGLTSTAADLAVLRVTIRTRYGTGATDFIELDGYRTRYAPNALP